MAAVRPAVVFLDLAAQVEAVILADPVTDQTLLAVAAVTVVLAAMEPKTQAVRVLVVMAVRVPTSQSIQVALMLVLMVVVVLVHRVAAKDIQVKVAMQVITIQRMLRAELLTVAAEEVEATAVTPVDLVDLVA